MDATAEQHTGTGEELNGNGGGEPGEQGDGERKSLQQLADEEPDEQQEEEQYTLFGTAPKLNNKVGGPKPTASAARFTAKRQTVPGQWEINDVLRGTFVGRIKDVQFPTKKQADGSYDTTRVHVIELERLSQAEDVPEEFAALDGRGRDPEYDTQLEQAQARIRELEELLEK